MGNKIVIGPLEKGLRLDRTAFVIDNDSFPTLINAFQWRGRVKRKRGTVFLNRLTRNQNIISANNQNTSINNLLTGLVATSTIQPGSVTITDNTAQVWVDVGSTGNITPGVLNWQGTNNALGTINYVTGLTTGPVAPFSVVLNAGFFNYFPANPVMGLEDFISSATVFPLTIGFDTTNSYNISTASIPTTSWDVSYYKNPGADGVNLPGYVPKTTANATSTSWNGANYQQFWTTNYQGALWTTNGIRNPFNSSSLGMQFAGASDNTVNNHNVITYISNTATTLVVSITNCPLVIGDFVFVNEWTGTNSSTLNFQSGYVTASSINTLPRATKTLTITFPFATIGAGPYAPGILQYLTNRSNTLIDNIRWYDGDPTGGVSLPVTFVQGSGWVNFMPPISQATLSIADLPAAQYYLVGAVMITPFKDRLLFIGPVVQTSTGTPKYLQDVVVYSQNGSPYYTASFPITPPTQVTSSNVVFSPILTPTNQIASAPSYFADSTGFGGFVQIGIDEPINTESLNQDVLILGLDTHQVRMVYTGNDIIPFNFFVINSELGSSSTFSSINMDKGVLTRGSRGFIITSQNEAQRFDLPIPDEVFQTDTLENGIQRVCAQRDFQNEWVQFTYVLASNANDDGAGNVFPNYTLQYNYRDQSWASFYENYTTYGAFRESTQVTWATLDYQSWEEWTDPWYESLDNAGQPIVIGGNQQGFILVKDYGIEEGTSIYIQGISGNVITSVNHCLNNNDYILITGCLGTIGSFVNDFIFQVSQVTINTFAIGPIFSTGTYLGNGVISKVIVPMIQTKQFPVAWEYAKKTRLGPQMYLLSTTANSQITLLIFLSQNPNQPYNIGPIVPASQSLNNSLVYSTILYTCPESTNLGLTPANTNLQMVTATEQEQIWHRINTSLLGDTVQLGFTVSNDQVFQIDAVGVPYAITGVVANTYPTVLNISNANFEIDSLIQINGIGGITQLNYNPAINNFYSVLAITSTTVTINIDSTSFGMYTTGGTATQFAYTNLGTEIELHSIILDVSPSMSLA